MDAAYAARYRHLYHTHWWWRAREDYLLGVLRGLDLGGRSLAILDVGCGDGLFFPRLREFGEPEGVEPDASIVTAEGLRSGRIHTGPFDLTFEPGKRYDLILLLDVVEHVADDVLCLRRAVTLLEPSGHLVVTVPAFPVLWTMHDEINHHVVRYTGRTLRRAAERAGMRIDRLRYFDHWTFGAKLLIRAKEKLIPPSPQPPTVPPAWLNETLLRLTKWEHRTLGRLHLPFGSSLLAVGGAG